MVWLNSCKKRGQYIHFFREIVSINAAGAIALDARHGRLQGRAGARVVTQIGLRWQGPRKFFYFTCRRGSGARRFGAFLRAEHRDAENFIDYFIDYLRHSAGFMNDSGYVTSARSQHHPFSCRQSTRFPFRRTTISIPHKLNRI